MTDPKHITAAECREHVFSNPPKMQRALHRAADAIDAQAEQITTLKADKFWQIECEKVNALLFETRQDLASAKARCERMANAIEAWWANKRPVAYSRAEHVANATVNCTTDAEQQLARVAALADETSGGST